MRNYFAIAFIIVYLILTVGVAKSTHYCMGRFNNTTLFSFDSKKCACALLTSLKSSCCHDEVELISLDDDQQAEQAVQTNAPEFFLIESLAFNSIQEIISISSFYSQLNKVDRPPTGDTPIFIFNCSLVYYAADGVSA
jgi:hypothetical protein